MKNRFKKKVVIFGAIVSIFSYAAFASSNSAYAASYKEENSTTEISCTNNSSGFSWFSCTIAKKSNTAASGIFSFIEERFLRIDADVFGDDSMYNTWALMRNIANLIMVIVLLVTILSQVSGVGISNYGVKKALPRLVIAALVINLSFFLSRAAIELANICGVAIEGVFRPLTESAKAAINAGSSSNSVIKSSGPYWVAGGSVFALITSALAVKDLLTSGESITMMILLAGLSACIAVVIFFVTVVCRQALMILLTITSPLMVICYIFPGTKTIWRQWFNMFKMLIFAYPIISFMVYGGTFASTIILAAMGTESPFALIIALTATVVPIITIPTTIIKSTGVVGQAIQNTLNRFNNYASGRLNNTEFAQRRKRAAEEAANRRLAGVDKEGKERTGLGARFLRAKTDRQRFDAGNRAAQDRVRLRSEDLMSGDDGDRIAKAEEMDEEAEAFADINRNTVSNPSNDKDESQFIGLLNSQLSTAVNDPDLAAARIEGLIMARDTSYRKNGARGATLNALRSAMNSASSKEQAEAYKTIARRLLNDGNVRSGKEESVRMGLSDIANAGWNDSTNSVDRIPSDMDNIEKIAMGNNFNANMLSNFTVPEIEKWTNAMRNPNFSSDAKKNIAAAYRQMSSGRAGQSMDSGDFAALGEAVSDYNAQSHPPTP